MQLSREQGCHRWVAAYSEVFSHGESQSNSSAY